MREPTEAALHSENSGCDQRDNKRGERYEHDNGCTVIHVTCIVDGFDHGTRPNAQPLSDFGTVVLPGSYIANSRMQVAPTAKASEAEIDSAYAQSLRAMARNMGFVPSARLIYIKLLWRLQFLGVEPPLKTKVVLFLRKWFLRLAAGEGVGPRIVPEHLSRLPGDLARSLDHSLVRVSVCAIDSKPVGHGFAPCCAGGSALGLSATDAYGQSLGR